MYCSPDNLQALVFRNSGLVTPTTEILRSLLLNAPKVRIGRAAASSSTRFMSSSAAEGAAGELKLSDAEWKKRLTPAEYKILRQGWRS